MDNSQPSSPPSSISDDKPSSYDKLNDMFEQWITGLPAVAWPSVHPGHSSLTLTLLFSFSAWQEYRIPMDSFVQKTSGEDMSGSTPKTTTRGNPLTTTAAATAKTAVGASTEPVPQYVAVSIANRAFRIATKCNAAGFGLFSTLVCYSAGWTSLTQASQDLQRWARPKPVEDETPLSQLVPQIPNHRAHSDSGVTRDMDETQEWDYVVNKYLSWKAMGVEETEEEIMGKDKKDQEKD